jgi:hypothetical protein
VDVYALACVLHELVASRRAFAGEFPSQVRGHLLRPSPRPSLMITTLPPALDLVVAGDMTKDPAGRFPTAGVLAAQARAALVPASGPKRSTRRQVLVAASAGFAVVEGAPVVLSVDKDKALARIDLRTSRPLGPPVRHPEIDELWPPLEVVELAGRPCVW